MASVTATPVMHEEMHQRAGQQRQPNQQAEDVRAMLSEQECAGDDRKSDDTSPAREVRKLP